MNMHVPALQRSLSDVVAEYDSKAAEIPAAMKVFEQACADLKSAASVAGTFGDSVLDGRVGVYRESMDKALLKSAWRHVYDGLNIKVIASARDRKLFEQEIEDPAPFTVDNIRATFGRYILDPRGNILRGLAEVFCGLDQAYRSHEKMKIGVEGLPKRVILSNVGGYGSWGRERLADMLNALASYRGEPLISHDDLKDVDALHTWKGHVAGQVVIRGLTVKKFMNGNAHVMFNRAALNDVNRALAEYYGDVLPDCPEERPAKQASTAVSKDLQFYPTPLKVIDDVLRNVTIGADSMWLEPSCGDGRMMDALHNAGAEVVGYEVDPVRAAIAKAKGHGVYVGNFLDAAVDPQYDGVLMNPPFYGKHYAKHVRHACKFLKPGGRLIAILPATARDHGLLDDLGVRGRYSDGPWTDLPVGSFSESGTNINTVLFSITKGE